MPTPQTTETKPAIAAVIAVLTGLVGAVEFSIPASQQYGITTLYLWPIAISALAIFGGFVFSAAVGMFFGFYPARKAAALNPIEALRYE